LLNRTTRRVGLTEAGRAFLQRIGPALHQLDEAVGELEEWRGTATGTLRLSVSAVVAATLITPLLAAFHQRHADVRLDIVVDDRLVDLVAGEFDAGIRLGESLAPGMVAVRVTEEQSLAVVGSPDYFRRHPPPVEPSELHQHPCIRYRFGGGAIYQWEFGRGGQDFTVEIEGPLICNDHALSLDAVRQGLGLVQVIKEAVREELTAGTLVQTLADWCPPFAGFYLYYPSRAQMPAKLRVFIDFLLERLR
jgi:DNA-binding transcriptional LysR family regulator